MTTRMSWNLGSRYMKRTLGAHTGLFFPSPRIKLFRASPSDYNPFEKQPKRAIFVVGSDDCVRRSLDEPVSEYPQHFTGNSSFVTAYSGLELSTWSVLELTWTQTLPSRQIGSMQMVKEKKRRKKIKTVNCTLFIGIFVFLERRLPCHMYLNGCPRKKNCSIPSLFLPFIFFLILRF